MSSLILGPSDLTFVERGGVDIDNNVHTGVVCSKGVPFHSDFELRGYMSWASVTRKLLSKGKRANVLVVIGLSSESGEEDWAIRSFLKICEYSSEKVWWN